MVFRMKLLGGSRLRKKDRYVLLKIAPLQSIDTALMFPLTHSFPFSKLYLVE